MRKQPSSIRANWKESSSPSLKSVAKALHAFLLEYFIQNRVVQHTLFWVLSYYILLRFFAYEDTLYTVDFVYDFLFHISLGIVVYFNLLLLVPKLLNKQRYLFYLLAVALLLLAGIYLNKFTFEYFADLLFPRVLLHIVLQFPGYCPVFFDLPYPNHAAQIV